LVTGQQAVDFTNEACLLINTPMKTVPIEPCRVKYFTPTYYFPKPFLNFPKKETGIHFIISCIYRKVIQIMRMEIKLSKEKKRRLY
jgi:hypothetical protein